MVLGEELPEWGQNSEYVEWVQMYRGDAVCDVCFFPFHIALMSFRMIFLPAMLRQLMMTWKWMRDSSSLCKSSRNGEGSAGTNGLSSG